MRAMTFSGTGHPLGPTDLPPPLPGPGQILIRVRACGVCRTDLHIVDGEIADPKLPLVLGHQIVGIVEGQGPGADRFAVGARVGVPWLGWTCGVCPFCRSGRENLCDRARFTGWHIDGGFAELTVADQRYCFALPERYSDVDAAPLLCAGLIGYRALRAAGDARRVGLFGFGAAAHLIAQAAVHEGREVHAFTRPGDAAGQAFARQLGAVWAGGSDQPPPAPLDAALIFAPVGALVPVALRAVAKGGAVICAGIHMSDIPSFPYADLWGERSIRSIANLTRADGDAFLALAGAAPIAIRARTYPLGNANRALDDLRAGRIEGAAVLVPDPRP